jgi:hypothetical protein
MVNVMNISTQNTTNSAVPGLPKLPKPSGESAETAVTAAELQVLKEEKLAVIRRALENGDYDSDAVLEKALDRMLERLEEADRA